MLPLGFQHQGGASVFLIDGNSESTVDKNAFVNIENLQQKMASLTQEFPFLQYADQYYNLFFEIVLPNIVLDENFTSKAIEETLKNVAVYRVDRG